jgi:alginate O-acetyltransferase complex protein AlgI
MLFNSFAFLLAFLPCAFALHWLVDRFWPHWRLPLLVLMSVVFYGYWDWRFVPLLLASIVVNWLVAELFLKSRSSALITGTITLNLLVLAVFKYFNFFAASAELIPGVLMPRSELALPLGISFFTFHHIMYLTDLRRGQAPRYDLTRYALYISFFPQVLAGPLVRWREIMHQFDERPYKRADGTERVARGLMLLTLGLVKKVWLGDPMAEIANPIFAKAAAGGVISLIEAWYGMTAFSLQIYFDFSGYTDMALGIALMFGILLPQNFNAPYRATSLQDFWRRWHMTLSRFLRDYLYIPLGGNRFGLPVQLWALFATMALGGLWHGASWTFVAWGVLHGLGLGAGVLWRRAGLTMPTLLGWVLTSLFVGLCWVMFRAESFSAATAMYGAMLGLGPIKGGPLIGSFTTLCIATTLSVLAPSAFRVAHAMPPFRSVAIAFALLFVLVLFKIGDDGNYQFIYFQF